MFIGRNLDLEFVPKVYFSRYGNKDFAQDFEIDKRKRDTLFMRTFLTQLNPPK
jgi:hypothetical protein